MTEKNANTFLQRGKCKCKCGGDAWLSTYETPCFSYDDIPFVSYSIVCSRHCGIRTKWYVTMGNAINAWNKMMKETE